ncbi:MAG TPA: hypothetical protein VEW42_06000 [Candidatus Eisenbacteria bacterium]|nr:hypothetical protein [Candidatus Eisenbacteria bacterium]
MGIFEQLVVGAVVDVAASKHPVSQATSIGLEIFGTPDANRNRAAALERKAARARSPKHAASLRERAAIYRGAL